MRVYLSGSITDNKNYHLDFLKAENRVTSIFKGATIERSLAKETNLPIIEFAELEQNTAEAK
nr:MAG TPA: hypothetical protein [Caudoviricetes sp.]